MRKILLICLLLLLSSPSFGQVKISQMPSGGIVQSTDFIPVVRGGVNFKASITGLAGNPGDIQTNLNGTNAFGSFSLNTTAGSGNAASGLLLNNNGVTQALSIGTNELGWSNQVTPIDVAANARYQISQGLDVDPRNYGAKCNAQYADGRQYVPRSLGSVTMANGSPVISINGYTWKSTDVGKYIAVNAGIDGDAGVGTGTIISVDLVHNTATMSVSPTISTNGGVAIFGADDTAAFVAAATQAAPQGGHVIVPSNCAVRELHLPNFVTLQGQAVETDYNYNFIMPAMYVLATGFTEDSTSYGINITDTAQLGLSGFEIRGPVSFPSPAARPGFANEKLSLVGSDAGTALVRAGVVLDHMSLQQGYTCFGTRINLATPVPIPGVTDGHIFFESRFSEFSTCAWGMHGAFSDGMMVGDVFTGNQQGYGAAYWGAAPGFGTTAMRLSEVRFEENRVGIYCDACNGNHLDGTEFEFNTGFGLVLNGQWKDFWMTGGYFVQSDQQGSPANLANVQLSGFGNNNHPVATFVNVLVSGDTYFIDNASSGSHPTIQYLGGIAIKNDVFQTNSLPPENFANPAGTGGALWATRYQPAYGAQYLTGRVDGFGVYGVNDLSINLNHALGLQTTNAATGSIFDSSLAGTSTLTGSLIPPVGTTANRPTSPVKGMLRYNSTTDQFEGYTGAWGSLGGGSGPVSVKTANYSVLAVDNNTTFTNTGASGSVTFTLPTAAAALSYCFFVDAAQTFVIAADSGHTIRNGLSVTSAGGNFTSNVIGNQMCLRALNTTEWYVYAGPTGSWTVN